MKQPDKASAAINYENQREASERQIKFELYLAAVRELYELLNMDVLLLASFKTQPRLLKHFYLTQLIISSNVDESDLGVKLSLLLYRFDSNTYLTDITADANALAILNKQNTLETWQKISVRRPIELKDEPVKAPQRA